MAVASAASVRFPLYSLVLALSAALCAPPAVAAAADSEAQKNRKKPLQRCDQLKGDAELDCLQKARERVVEARKKREASQSGDSTSADGKKGADSTKAEGSGKGAEPGKAAESSRAADAGKSDASSKRAESQKPASDKSKDAGKGERKQ